MLTAASVQRPVEDAGRAAAARQVHLRHDRSPEDPAHDPVALPAVRLRRDQHVADPRAAQADRGRARGWRPTTRRCASSPAGPAARCATPSRCSNSSCRSAANADRRRRPLDPRHRGRRPRGRDRRRDPRRRTRTSALGLVAKCADEGLQLGELLDQLDRLLARADAAQLLGRRGRRPERRRAPSGGGTRSKPASIDARHDPRRARRPDHDQGPAANDQSRQVLLEMAVVRLSRLDELVPLAQLAQSLEPTGTARPAVESAGTMQSALADASKKNGMTGLADAVSHRGTNGVQSASGVDRAKSVPISDANLSQIWDKVKIEVGVMFAGELGKAGLPAIVWAKNTGVALSRSSTITPTSTARTPARAKQVEGRAQAR